VLRYSKYRISLLYSRGIPPRIFCDGTRWRCAVNFNFRRIFPHRKNHRYALNCRQDVTTIKDRLDKSKFSCTIMETEPRWSSLILVTIHKKLLRFQIKFSDIFSLHLRLNVRKRKTNVWYSSQLPITSISGTTYYIQVIYTVVQNVWNHESCVSVPAPASFSGTYSFCWRFCLLAVIWRPIHHLVDIYVVLLQLLQHAVLCLFVRVLLSIRHIDICCKKIIEGCKN